MIKKDPEVERYEQLFDAVGRALLDINATPAEALMSICVFSDMMIAIKMNNPVLPDLYHLYHSI